MTVIQERCCNAIINACNKIVDRLSHKVDWEQRRYEIAKDIASARFGKDYGSFKNEEVAPFAVARADELIAELKKETI